MPFEVLHSPGEWMARFGASGTGSVLTVGNFDGLHLGHQKILRDVVERARAASAVATVLTFDPPPSELARLHGFAVQIVPPVLCRGEIVSSTAIRREMAEGNVSHAARLLGRPFVLTGEIRRGTGTGRKFVFPTLNLAPDQELLPAQGVYVTETNVEGRLWRSATNVGRRPTFNGAELSIESHLLGFARTLTQGRMEIHFWKRLREEKKFSGPEELRRQITKDIARANNFFSRLDRARRARQSA